MNPALTGLEGARQRTSWSDSELATFLNTFMQLPAQYMDAPQNVQKGTEEPVKKSDPARRERGVSMELAEMKARDAQKMGRFRLRSFLASLGTVPIFGLGLGLSPAPQTRLRSFRATLAPVPFLAWFSRKYIRKIMVQQPKSKH